MTQQEQGPVHAPEFPPNATWLQGGPLTMASLRGRPVLIDFWDYTCLNCLRTLPYLREWHRRYGDIGPSAGSGQGLAIIGVHAPEFSFAHHIDNVRRAVAEQELAYPIVLDNDYAIWQSYANRYWPAKYLIDGKGYLRAYHFGEGGYGETESAIQMLLRESFADAVLPAPMEPVRDEDKPGAVCYRVTPELYLGYQRGRIGNTAGIAPDTVATYTDLGKHAEGFFFLEGDWLLTAEAAARPVGAQGESRLHLRYMAKDVNLVMMPPLADRQGRIELLQDGEPLAAEDAGEDVGIEDPSTLRLGSGQAGSGQVAAAIVRVDAPRMYRLVRNREINTHELTLVTRSDGIMLYAFTFGSCVAAR
jgi:thiol-disulfide isomerase/thioredoxin